VGPRAAGKTTTALRGGYPLSTCSAAGICSGLITDHRLRSTACPDTAACSDAIWNAVVVGFSEPRPMAAEAPKDSLPAPYLPASRGPDGDRDAATRMSSSALNGRNRRRPIR
jgi:hypothetical protein